MDWSQPVVIPAVGKAAGLRRLIFVLLWLASHIIDVALLFLVMVGWRARLIVKPRKRRQAKVGQVSGPHTMQAPV